MANKNNKIQINLKSLPSSCRDVVDHTLETAKKHHYIIELRDSQFVYCDEATQTFPVEGYIDPISRKIVVAAGRSFKKWVPVFVHESCHLDQKIENVDVWNNVMYKGEDAGFLVDEWIEQKRELGKTDLFRCVKRVQAVEHDCETRTLQKFEQFNLPFDPIVYAQQSNAYIWFYTFVRKERVWHPPGNTPVYLKPEVYQLMPEQLMNINKYSRMPKPVFEAYQENL